MNISNEPLVYSTNPEKNKSCPKCKRLIPECRCSSDREEILISSAVVLTRIPKLTVRTQEQKLEPDLREENVDIHKKCLSMLSERKDGQDLICTSQPKADPPIFVAGNSAMQLRNPGLRIERAGRRGKTVTVIDRLPKSEKYLKDLAKKLKMRCGTGGTYLITGSGGQIEIQGDQREALRALFQKEGIKLKG